MLKTGQKEDISHFKAFIQSQTGIMKISIITICYNNENSIRRTVESVVGQTYDNIEYIVVDGQSTDGTLLALKQYETKIAKIISEPDNGIYDAINKGIKHATGDIVGLIHAGDQLYDNDVVKDIADHFLNNDIDISYGHSKIIGQSGKTVRINISPAFRRRLMYLGWMPSHQSIYVKRSLFDKYGYYSTDYALGDYEWFIRFFSKRDVIIKRIDRFIIKFKTGGVSTANYTKKLKSSSHKKVKQCWEINKIKAPCCVEYLKLARKIPQFLYASLENFGLWAKN